MCGRVRSQSDQNLAQLLQFFPIGLWLKGKLHFVCRHFPTTLPHLHQQTHVSRTKIVVRVTDSPPQIDLPISVLNVPSKYRLQKIEAGERAVQVLKRVDVVAGTVLEWGKVEICPVVETVQRYRLLQ